MTNALDKVTYSKLFDPLPPHLGGSSNPEKEYKTEKFVEFLKDNVPASDQKEIEGVLTRNLPLAKQSKRQKNKPPAKRKGKYLTAKEKRELNLYKVKNESNNLKFETFKKLHYLWKDYMREIIDFESLKKSGETCNDHPLQEFGGRIKAILHEPVQLKICRADLHGCYFKVSKALNSCLVGHQGIVVMETRNSFQIINKKNSVKTIPKHGSSFTFVLDGVVITLNGSSLCMKPTDRAVKKWKKKPMFDF